VEPRKTPTLPSSVATPADVGRLARELEQIDQALLQLKLRAGGANVKLPKTSRLMDQTTDRNGLNLLKAADRKLLKRFLELVEDMAPRLHFSFSADPSAAFTEKLISWLRQEINPHLIITIGLQPSIGAGCMVRTANKYFDFSLKQTFIDQRPFLMKKLFPEGQSQHE
jgi:hypothetical protein